MSRGSDWQSVMFHFNQNPNFMHFQEAVVDLISGRATRYNTLDSYNNQFFGLDFANIVEVGDYYSDEDSNAEDPRDNKSYCGFPRNFLGPGPPKPKSPHPPHILYRTGLREITCEEAERNAKDLLEEEDRLKTKAEKKKLKKLRQKERKRQEKEMETLVKNKDGASPEAEDSVTKSKFSNSEIASNMSDGCIPPDTGPVKTPACSAPLKNSANSNEPCKDEEEEEEESESESESEEGSIASESELLDMNSCFVSKAATIAKRKLELKAKSERKEEKKRISRKQGQPQRQPQQERPLVEPQERQEQQQNAEMASVEDVVNRSMELAGIGNQLAAVGSFSMAVKYFTDAIKHNPKEFRLFGNRSFCYERLLQYDKSLIDADITLAMSPGWIKGLFRRGRALAGLKRYSEAALAFKEVLKQSHTSTDAAQELMRVQIMQLMEMGFSREQSSNALIIHGTVEKALQAFSSIQDDHFGGSSNLSVANACQSAEQEWVVAGQKAQPPVSLSTKPQTQAQSKARPLTPVKVNPAKSQPQVELFPVWVGNLVPAISEEDIYRLFRVSGQIHSVKMLQTRRCAFVNYVRRQDCEAAITATHGKALAGTVLSVRYPDRIHMSLGASKSAKQATEQDHRNATTKKSDECYYWRMGGCVKMERCIFKHIPHHKGIDGGEGQSRTVSHSSPSRKTRSAV